jgi:hypothetical protein
MHHAEGLTDCDSPGKTCPNRPKPGLRSHERRIVRSAPGMSDEESNDQYQARWHRGPPFRTTLDCKAGDVLIALATVVKASAPSPHRAAGLTSAVVLTAVPDQREAPVRCDAKSIGRRRSGGLTLLDVRRREDLMLTSHGDLPAIEVEPVPRRRDEIVGRKAAPQKST